MAGWGWDGWFSRPSVEAKVTFTSPFRGERGVSHEYTSLLELRYFPQTGKRVSSTTMRSDDYSEIQEPCRLSTPACLQNRGDSYRL